jgi:hypothetical protein
MDDLGKESKPRSVSTISTVGAASLDGGLFGGSGGSNFSLGQIAGKPVILAKNATQLVGLPDKVSRELGPVA